MNSNDCSPFIDSKKLKETITPHKSQHHNPEFDPIRVTKHVKQVFRSERKMEAPQQRTAESLRYKIQYLIHYYFEHDQTGFKDRAENFFVEEWDNIQLKVSKHLNIISFLQQSLKYQPFGEVEVVLVQQWKQNSLLYGLQILWNYTLGNFNFKSLPQLRIYYAAFRKFIAQALYLLFQNCFLLHQQKGIEVLTRLEHQTAVFIITKANGWKKSYDKFKHLIVGDISPLSSGFDLKSLLISPKILDVISTVDQFIPTQEFLSKFINQIKVFDKLSLLRSFRKNLQQDMNNSVALKRQFDDKCITYEKEDYLDCVIYCVVHYKLYGLGEALAYLRFTLGKQIDAILSSWQTGSYYADLQAVYEHLQSDNNPPPQLMKKVESKYENINIEGQKNQSQTRKTQVVCN